MAKVKVKMSSAGAVALMNSSGVQANLMEHASRIGASANSMGSGTYVADVQPGRERAHAMVKTTDAASRRDNARNNTLLKAMGR